MLPGRILLACFGVLQGSSSIDLSVGGAGGVRVTHRSSPANDYLGAVSGYLRASLDGQSIAMPFCGLWRFRDGRIIEHWENAYSPTKFAEFLSQHLLLP